MEEIKPSCFMHSENLKIALIQAIEYRSKYEESQGYTGDSALVAGWKQNLAALNNGETLNIKYS